MQLVLCAVLACVLALIALAVMLVWSYNKDTLYSVYHCPGTHVWFCGRAPVRLELRASGCDSAMHCWQQKDAVPTHTLNFCICLYHCNDAMGFIFRVGGFEIGCRFFKVLTRCVRLCVQRSMRCGLRFVQTSKRGGKSKHPSSPLAVLRCPPPNFQLKRGDRVACLPWVHHAVYPK